MLPSIVPFEETDFREEFQLICAAGFEDRIEAVFETLHDEDYHSLIKSGLAIKYKPYKARNNPSLIEDGMSSVGLSEESVSWITYDRYAPDGFEPQFTDYLQEENTNRVLLDISGMSKLLIMQILTILYQEEVKTSIFYAEANTYHPTKKKFEEVKEKGLAKDESPAFLTSGIDDIVTSRSLSSFSKGGQPVVAITFPAFNYQKLSTLASEISPHLLVAIEGVPHHAEDEWRVDAVRWLNQEAESYVRLERFEASTFDYKETFELLQNLYSEYSDAYQLYLAPTGSKLQTVATALFRCVYSDIQIAYPVTRDFDTSYTEGWKKTWVIDFGSLVQTLSDHGGENDEKIQEIRRKIERLRREVNQN